MGVIAFGFGVLLAANRIRREAREASAALLAPAPAQFDRIVREFRHEIMALGEITNQPTADAGLFVVLAARLAGLAVAEKNSWASLDAAFANFTALFAPDFANMVDDLYAAAFDPFGNDSEATQATFNVCDAACAALEEAGYDAAPRRVQRAS
jgi:hypothetical protein